MFGVRSIPFCVLFKDGQPVDGFTGALPEGQLRQFLDQHVPGEGALQAETEASEAEALLEAGDTEAAAAKLADALALRQPFEVRVTFLNRLIFSPEAQWAASNTALSVLQALCQSDDLAADMSIDTLDGMDALARAQRLDMPIQSLDSFLGTLMHQRLG